MVGNEFHAAVGKLHGGVAGVRDVQLVERVLEPHDPHAHRTVAQVGGPGLGGRVVVDVDDVVEHPHGGADRRVQQDRIEAAVLDVLDEVDGAEVAHGDLALATY